MSIVWLGLIYRCNVQSVVEDGLRFTSYSDEASLSPGVPIMRTLDDFIKTGDAIIRIEAMLNPGINVALDALCAPRGKPQAYLMPSAAHKVSNGRLSPYDDKDS